MIYVVEMRAGDRPRAWFAYDDADFARKVAASDPAEPWEIYDCVTPRELLAQAGCEGGGVGGVGTRAREQYPAISAMGDEYGWDTPLYRADYLLGRGVCRHEAVDPRDAAAAALGARGGQCLIYWSDEAALAAFEGADPRLAGETYWPARRALYEQLVALEVLADDN